MNEFFASILSGLNSVIGNYGWSMVVFTLLFKILLLPLQYKSRKGMRRMTDLQPQLNKLQKKYANDKDKLNIKMSELYRKEGVSPMSGCLPMILSMAILIIMFNAMRMVANEELAQQSLHLLTTGVQTNETWLWVKNIWMPDSPFNPVIADSNSLQMIPADVWNKVYAAFTAANPDSVALLAGMGVDAATVSGATVFTALQNSAFYLDEVALWSTLPSLNLILTQVKIYAHNNGWFILPLLACATQFLMTATQPQQPQVEGQPNTGKFMKYFFPLFTLFICSGYNAAFALYWVVSNIYGWIETVVINKVLEKQDAAKSLSVKEDSVK